jgi:hypothetical protein
MDELEEDLDEKSVLKPFSQLMIGKEATGKGEDCRGVGN